MSWPFKPLNELCLLAVDCVNKTAPVVDYDTGYRMIRTTNIKGGFIDLDSVRYVTEEVFEKWTRRSRPQYGDVILTREAPVGEVGRFTEDVNNVFLGQRLFHYRPDPELLDWNYLAYALQSRQIQGRLKGMGFGATVDHIRVGDAETLAIPCPPLSVQRSIGNILASYDDLIENNQRRIQLLEESARLLYKEWFVHLRFPGHEHVKVTNGVPEGWEPCLLPQVIEVNPKERIEKGKEIAYVPMSALSETNMTVDVSKFEQRTKHTNVKFRQHDVLLARITPCLENGKTGYVYFLKEDEQACGSTEFIVLRGKRVSSAFTYCLARSEHFRETAIQSMTGSSGRQRVQASSLADYSVPLPPQHLLEMFDEVALQAFEQIGVLMAQNERLAKARDLLLPKLMSGELAA